MDVHYFKPYEENGGTQNQTSNYVRQDQPRCSEVTFVEIRPVSQPQVTGSSYVPHVILAAVVCLFFGVVFGLVALIFAVRAARLRATDPNGHAAAKRFGDKSIQFSIIGIVVGFLLAFIIGLTVGLATHGDQYAQFSSMTSDNFSNSSDNCYVGPDGQCYLYTVSDVDQYTCTNLYQGIYDPDVGLCYNNVADYDYPGTAGGGNDVNDTSVTMTTDVYSACVYNMCYQYKVPTPDNSTCTSQYNGVFDPTSSLCYFNTASTDDYGQGTISPLT